MIEQAAIKSAKYLIEVGEDEYSSRIPKEDFFKCSMMHFLMESSPESIVIPEATYIIDKSTNNKLSCDLKVTNRHNKTTLWIEIKRLWCAHGYINKPDEQKASWIADGEKLDYINTGEKTNKHFYIFAITDEDLYLPQGKHSINARNAIDTIWEDWGKEESETYKLRCIFNKPLNWDGSDFNFVSIWTTQW